MRSKFKGVALVAAIVVSKYLLLEVWEYRTFCHKLSRNLLDGIIGKTDIKLLRSLLTSFFFRIHVECLKFHNLDAES